MTSSTILLTATVRPNTHLHLAQADPAVRLAQYQHAIGVWAAQAVACDAELFVVETSGARPADLLSSVPVRTRSDIRVLSHEAGSSERAGGKGLFEAEAIRHGAEAVAQELGTDRTIHKATGRLVLTNATHLVRALPPEVVQIRMTTDRTFADTRFIGAAASVWLRVLLADAEHIDEPNEVYLEHVVAGSVARAAAMKTIRVERFPRRPSFEGQSGSTGRNYRGGGSPLLSRLARIGEDGLAALAARKQV